MSEIITPRLMAAAKEFNIGTSTLVDFLVTKGFSSDDLKPTSKLTEPMYRVLQSEFQQDKVAKQKAQQIDLPKGANAGEPKKKRDEEDLSIKKKEAAKAKEAKPPVEEVKPPAPEVAKPEAKEEPKETKEKEAALTKIEAPELESPKVLDKIDLDAIDSSTRPKKSAKKKEEPVAEEPKKGKKKTEEAPAEEPKKAKKKTEEKVVEEPVIEPKVEEPQKDALPVIENIQAKKLSGPKIMGKIDLPVDNDTRPKKSEDEKRK
ncbi:MAG TPA: hypothetical protein VK489_01605, partial [Ferruginibacter sp.]|nr:hypothetical protein [Ferruginibacter sp.]